MPVAEVCLEATSHIWEHDRAVGLDKDWLDRINDAITITVGSEFRY